MPHITLEGLECSTTVTRCTEIAFLSSAGRKPDPKQEAPSVVQYVLSHFLCGALGTLPAALLCAPFDAVDYRLVFRHKSFSGPPCPSLPVLFDVWQEHLQSALPVARCTRAHTQCPNLPGPLTFPTPLALCSHRCGPHCWAITRHSFLTAESRHESERRA